MAHISKVSQQLSDTTSTVCMNFKMLLQIQARVHRLCVVLAGMLWHRAGKHWDEALVHEKNLGFVDCFQNNHVSTPS